MRGQDRGRLHDSGEGPIGRHRLLTILKYAGAVIAILGVLLALAAGNPTDPQASVDATATQRHTPSSPTGTSTGAPAATEKAIEFTAALDAVPAELARYYGQHPVWTTCKKSKDQCATVRVPIDYAAPGGPTINVAMRKHVAGDPAARKGSLFINPGGPGGSGFDFVAEAKSYFGRDVRDVWDIIGFDPRGMGESAGFPCLTDADLDSMFGADPTPDSTSEAASLRRAESTRLERCARRGGALAGNMGSEAVARDLDIMRDAVGDDRLNYLGVSYGTMLGSVYADLYTSRVGLMVLDSAVAPDGFGEPDPTQEKVDDYERSDAADFEGFFAEFADACVDDDCPIATDAAGVRIAVINLLDSLEKRPLPTEFDTLPKLTEGWAATAIRLGLNDSDSWSYLADALDTAIHDKDGSDLAWFAMIVTGREEDGTYEPVSFDRNHLPVSCADWPVTGWDKIDPDPGIGDEFPIWKRLGAYSRHECDGWTGTLRKNLLVGAEPATPILVIGNERDPVTPIDSTKYLSDMLVRSRFVEVDAEGHGAYGAGNSCADKAVDDYLARSIPPTLDLKCPKE